MKRILLSIAIILFQGLITIAQDTLSLKEAITLALQNNYAISLARNSAKITDLSNSTGNAGMLPKLDLSGTQSTAKNNSHAEYFDGRIRDVPKAETNTKNASLQLSWTIFDGFNMFIQRDKLNELQQLSNIQLRGVIENTISQVCRAYYELVVEQKKLKLYQEALQISIQRKQFTKARLDLGNNSELAYLQATVDMNADSAKVIQQTATVKNSVSDLNLLLCRDLKTGIMVDDDITVTPALNYEDLWAKVDTQNLYEMTDFKGYQADFLKLFGFGFSAVNYEADVNPEVF